MLRLRCICRTSRVLQPKILLHGPLNLGCNYRSFSSNEKTDQNKSNLSNESDPLNIDELFPDLYNESRETPEMDEPISKNRNFSSKMDDQNIKPFEKESLLADIDTYVDESSDNRDIDPSAKEKSEFEILNEFINDHNDSQLTDGRTADTGDEFNDLLSSLKMDEDSQGNKETTGFENLGEMTKERLLKKRYEADEFNLIDVDKNDENIFDISFLDGDKNRNNEKKVIEEEKELFQNIFNSYIRPSDQDEQSQLLQNLRNSVNISKNQIDDILKSSTSNRYKLTNVSGRLKDELFSKASDALKPTIDYLQMSPDLNSSALLTQYLRTVFQNWFEIIRRSKDDKSILEDIYLDKLLRRTTKFGDKHSKFIDFISTQSIENPSNPPLNVFTLPIIFNAVLNTVTMKYHDGQLAMTLFNFLKKDINLYTVCCNQQTYNEILRAQWLFYGKSNLYGIEIIYIEMLNNGFSGDLKTFNILKQIIIDYHSLKMGQSSLNCSKLPIWSKEDDKRIENLERKLTTLANILKRSHI